LKSYLATVYVSEMSSRKHRGFFGCLLGTSVSFGLQFIVGVGSIIPTWDMSTVACMIPVVAGKTYNKLRDGVKGHGVCPGTQGSRVYNIYGTLTYPCQKIKATFPFDTFHKRDFLVHS